MVFFCVLLFLTALLFNTFPKEDLFSLITSALAVSCLVCSVLSFQLPSLLSHPFYPMWMLVCTLKILICPLTFAIAHKLENTAFPITFHSTPFLYLASFCSQGDFVGTFSVLIGSLVTRDQRMYYVWLQVSEFAEPSEWETCGEELCVDFECLLWSWMQTAVLHAKLGQPQ